MSSRAASTAVSEDSEDEDEEEDESAPPIEESATTTPAESTLPPSSFRPSPTLSLFLTHLTLACTGNPQSYPTILLLLSTLPHAVLPPSLPASGLLFDSFWAAWGGRALAIGAIGSNPTSISPIEEFVTALLECIVWQTNALTKAGESVTELVVEWIGRVWRTYLGQESDSPKLHKGIATARVADQVLATLAKLSARSEGTSLRFVSKQSLIFNSVDVSNNAWTTAIAPASISAVSDTRSASLPPLASALVRFAASDSTIASLARPLAVQCVAVAVIKIISSNDPTKTNSLLSFVEALRSVASSVSGTVDVSPPLDWHGTSLTLASQLLDTFVLQQIPALLSSPSSTSALHFLTDHLASTSPAARASIWSSVFTNRLPSPVMLQLIRAADDGTLPDDFANAELDEVVLEAAERVLGDSLDDTFAVDFEIVSRLMSRPGQRSSSLEVRFDSDELFRRTLRRSYRTAPDPRPHDQPTR